MAGPFQGKTEIKLIWRFSSEMDIYMIEYLLYDEAESEGTISAQKASWRGTVGCGQEGSR